MNWNQFLEQNQLNLDYEELEEIDEDSDEYPIFHMEDVVDSLEILLKTNGESVEDIIYIEQEMGGDPFELWTKNMVYFSKIDDSDYWHVYSTFRHPPDAEK